MKIIKTIDLWTEQRPNHQDCFSGAFIDGFEDGKIPFTRYKVIKNCNCLISTGSLGINITNKHNAIIFYYNDTPVRLMVIDKKTDVEKSIQIALNQEAENNQPLKTLYKKYNISCEVVDMKQPTIQNGCKAELELDVASCDRLSLLKSMIKGSYTESESDYGSLPNEKYKFYRGLSITYSLQTDQEAFLISHSNAFINQTKTKIIPIQDNSSLAEKVNPTAGSSMS